MHHSQSRMVGSFVGFFGSFIRVKQFFEMIFDRSIPSIFDLASLFSKHRATSLT